MAAMPRNFRSTLNAYRRKQHGSIPSARVYIGPPIIFGEMDAGENIPNSNKDLPDVGNDRDQCSEDWLASERK